MSKETSLASLIIRQGCFFLLNRSCMCSAINNKGGLILGGLDMVSGVLFIIALLIAALRFVSGIAWGILKAIIGFFRG